MLTNQERQKIQNEERQRLLEEEQYRTKVRAELAQQAVNQTQPRKFTGQGLHGGSIDKSRHRCNRCKADRRSGDDSNEHLVRKTEQHIRQNGPFFTNRMQ